MFQLARNDENSVEKNSAPLSECIEAGGPNRVKREVKRLMPVADDRSLVGKANGKRLYSSMMVTTRCDTSDPPYSCEKF